MRRPWEEPPCSEDDPPAWKPPTDGPPTSYAVKMAQAQAACDFDLACVLVGQQARDTARRTRKECASAGVPACVAFWEAMEQEARQARRLFTMYQEWPLSCLLEALHSENLLLYADALIGAVEWCDLVF